MELTLIPRENYGIIEYSLVVPFLYTYRKKCFKFQMLIMADPKFYTSSQVATFLVRFYDSYIFVVD